MSVQIGKYCEISEDVRFGDNVIVHGHANLYGCRIGDDCMIGTFVEIQRDVNVGKRVRIQSHTFICSNIVIEDDVFIGHNVSFANDRYPTSRKATDGTWISEEGLIRRGASIGNGVAILCGVGIGEGAIVGAGS
ncbi:MAG: N-acetyltransferase, partial [Candidatus Scalindua sp.]|nr:N-acetyltransferase [Candidatus Scalindua sp.]